MKYLLLSFFILLPVFGQAQSEEELLSEGIYFLRLEDYNEALYFFKKLYRTDTTNHNYNFRVGECYINIPNKEYLAIPHLEYAIQNISKEWNGKTLAEKRAPEHALFYLGSAYRIAGDLEKAMELYTEFTNIPNYYLTYSENYINQEIAAVERAKIIQDNPIKIKKTVIGEPIKSILDEFNPVINTTETKLVFIRKQKFYNAVMFSEKKGNGWSEPINITPMIESDGNMYPSYISPSGNFMLLTYQGKNDDDIYISHFVENRWTKAIPISEKINTKGDESSATLSADGKTMVFSSNRGTRDDYDLYISTKQNKDWSKPRKIDSEINSKGNEVDPVLSADGKILYFSSDSHFKMGGYDIFVSVVNNLGKWSIPKNIGFPINSTTTDRHYYAISKRTAYISTWEDRTASERNIWKIEILEPNENIYLPD